jgi:hypothetical protein
MSGRKFFQHVIYYVRFYVLTAASMKLGTFWDIALCSLGVDRRFRVMIHPDD